MNEFHTKMIEKEAKILANGMRREGLILTQANYMEILNDLMEIAASEIQEGRTPLGWLTDPHTMEHSSLDPL